MLRRKKSRLSVEALEHRYALSGAGFEIVEQSFSANSTAIELADLDGDNDLDTFISCHNRATFRDLCDGNSVWLNDGQGNFQLQWTGETDGVWAVALADFDGDADLDAFLGLGGPPPSDVPRIANEVWLNDGTGKFSDSGQRLGLGATYDVSAGDVDGDGDIDVVAANILGNSVIWLNDGQAVFSATGQELTVGKAVALGDLDADGDLDAFFGKDENQPNVVLINDGQGNFQDSGQELGGSFTNDVKLRDLDTDGDLDVFTANGAQFGDGRQPNRVWLNDGKGVFRDSGTDLGNLLSNSVELSDVDGDGDFDAFVANSGSYLCNTFEPSPCGQENKLWLNDGSGAFSDSELELGSSSSGSVAMGDVDGDSDPDALIGNFRVANELWLNSPTRPGDTNRDGAVDFEDFLALSANFNKDDRGWEHGDFSGDGVVDFADFLILSANFGEGVQDSQLESN